MMFKDFDVQAFIEECWITQAASDPSRANALAGAYSEPTGYPGLGMMPPQQVMAQQQLMLAQQQMMARQRVMAPPQMMPHPMMAPVPAPPMMPRPMPAPAAPPSVRESYESDGSASHLRMPSAAAPWGNA